MEMKGSKTTVQVLPLLVVAVSSFAFLSSLLLLLLGEGGQRHVVVVVDAFVTIGTSKHNYHHQRTDDFFFFKKKKKQLYNTINNNNDDNDSASTTTGSQQQQQSKKQKKKELGLLTFDLDDTLFHCGDVVKAANNAMLNAIHNYYSEEEEQIITTVPDFLETTKSIRKQLTSPITYKELRTRAIYSTLLQLQQRQNNNQLQQESSSTFAATMQMMAPPPSSSSSFSSDSFSNNGSTGATTSSNDDDDILQIIANDIYNIWLIERHNAAEYHLLDGALSTLSTIKLQYPNCPIVAITNGAGSPLEMPNTLEKYFDDCISGEFPDVFPNRKPNPYIYEYTLNKHFDYFDNNNNDDNENNDNANDDDVELIWCHVGDCLVNDIEASSKCGAKAIWLNTNENIIEDDNDGKTQKQQQPFYSTATLEEQQQREVQKQNAIKYVTFEINKLHDLPNAISSILT